MMRRRTQMMRRRAQVEMVGLVMVVALLIVGIVLYMSFSAKANTAGSAASRTQGSTDFTVALAATYLPACDVQFWEAAQACLDGKAIGSCTDPCAEIQRAMDAVAGATLQGYRYNLSLSSQRGTVAQNTSDCPSADQRLMGVTESTTMIRLESGASAKIVLALCPARRQPASLQK
jgi:hypothetical protein